MASAERERKTPEHVLERMRAAYTADPGKFKRRASAYRRKHRKTMNADTRAARAANPEFFRKRERAYREKDIERSNRRQRGRHQAGIPKVGAKDGKLFRSDPKREEKLELRHYVVCRVCLGKLKRLAGGKWPHLGLVHKLTDKEYDAKYPGAPLACLSLRRDLSKRAKQQMASAHGRPRQRIKVRGHEAPARKWPIVCGLVQGHSYRQIGADVGRTVQTVKAAADRLGFAGRAALYDFGIPVTGASFSQIKAASGLSANELARHTQLPENAMAEWVLPKYSGHRITANSARKLIEWRDTTLRGLLAAVSKPSRGLDRHSGGAVLKMLVPALRQRYDLLLAVLRHLRKSLQVNSSWGATEIQDYLCEQAMLEVAGRSTGKLFTKFLAWAPELMSFLEANLGQLRGRGNLWPTAYEAIAARWSTTPSVVAAATQPRTSTIALREMRRLVMVPEIKAQAPRGKRPGPKASSIQQRTAFTVGEGIETLLPRFRSICNDLLTLPRRARTNPDRASALLNGKNYSRQELEAATKSPGDSLIATRWFKAITTHREYSVIAKYHRTYRRVVSNPDPN